VIDPEGKEVTQGTTSSTLTRCVCAYNLGVVGLQAPIKVRFTDWADEGVSGRAELQQP